MARAIVYTEIGSPAVLHLIEVPDPVAARGEVVVRIEAAGANPIDAKLRGGKRPSPPITEPRPVGFDGAGVIEALGEGVDDFAVGDRVAIRDGHGTYSSALAIPTENLAKLPDSVTTAEGAGIGIPAGTAYQALRSLGVAEGDVLLVHGGSGAVGQAAVQFAVAWGATVIATGSPARHDQLRELGALPVAYGDGLLDRVRAAASSPSRWCSTAPAPTRRSRPPSPWWPTETASRRSCGGRMPRPSASAPSPAAPRAVDRAGTRLACRGPPETIALLDAGDFTIELGPQLPLAEAARAHELMESGAASGKIILLP